MIFLQGAKERVEVLRFSSNGESLAALYSAGVQLWNILSGDGRPAAVLRYSQVRSVRFTPDGTKLLLGGLRVLVHDLSAGKVAEVPLDCPTPSRWRFALCELSPDGRFLVAAEIDPERTLPDRVFCRSLTDPRSSLWSLESDRTLMSQPLFLAGGERFVLFEWRGWPTWTDPRGMVYATRDVRTGNILSEVGRSQDQFSLPILSADRRLVAARRSSEAAIFRADDFVAGPVVVLRTDNRKEFTDLAFHPSGRFLAATSNDAAVKFYDTATGTLAQAFDWDIGRVRSVAFSPDGMLAAAGGDRGKIVVWDVDL
jgi:WD40 repeat protein